MTDELFVFDLDDTLLDGDCAMLWNRFLVERGIITDPDFLARDNALMQHYRQGKLCMEAYLAFSLQPLQDVPVEQVQRWVDEWVPVYILPRVYPQAQALLARLQHQQQRTLIISATASFIVRSVARALGIDQALGIDVQTVAGKLTATIVGVASYREGKVQRLEQWLARQQLCRAQLHIHFYTDSINDLPLCQYADQVHLINPCPLLVQAAKADWSSADWRHGE